MTRRTIFLTVLLLFAMAFVSALVAQPAPGNTRTIRNGEGAPLVYLFVTDAVAAEPEAVIARLRVAATQLEEVAPRGMWRVSPEAGTIIGYYGGGPSAVAYRLIHRSVPAGAELVVLGSRDTLAVDGRNATISPWELPASIEPISLDGLNGDWAASAPVMRRSALAEPMRIESIADGGTLTLAESAQWTQGGTALRSLRTRIGRRSVFLSAEASSPFLPGTSIHIRVFPNRESASPAGEFVVPVDAESGPVVFRTPNGAVNLVGQYVRRERFVEFSIGRTAVQRVSPDIFDPDISFDLATSRRAIGSGERFALATL